MVRARVSTSPEFDRVTTHGDELREVLSTSALFGDGAWEEAVLRTSSRVRDRGREGWRGCRPARDPSDDLLLVVSGRLRVVLEASESDAETVLAELGRGETVGEAGLITGDPRSATVYAIRDAILATLDRESFEALCRRHPKAMMERFARRDSARMRREARGEHSRRRDFVARSHSSPRRELDSRVHRDLTRHLGALGPTACSRPLCDATLGRAGATTLALTAEDEANLVRWIGEHERANRFVLYCPDPGATRWNALSTDRRITSSSWPAGPSRARTLRRVEQRWH